MPCFAPYKRSCTPEKQRQRVRANTTKRNIIWMWLNLTTYPKARRWSQTPVHWILNESRCDVRGQTCAAEHVGGLPTTRSRLAVKTAPPAAANAVQALRPRQTESTFGSERPNCHGWVIHRGCLMWERGLRLPSAACARLFKNEAQTFSSWEHSEKRKWSRWCCLY